jgi:hypothetical protein
VLTWNCGVRGEPLTSKILAWMLLPAVSDPPEPPLVQVTTNRPETLIAIAGSNCTPPV